MHMTNDSNMVMVLCYHTMVRVWYGMHMTNDNDMVPCYHTMVRVPTLPSDPIHFHVFCYDYGILMTNDNDRVLCYHTMVRVPTLPSDSIHFVGYTTITMVCT